MATSVIGNFMVQLGFNVNSNEHKTFMNTVNQSREAFGTLQSGILKLASSVGISAGIIDFGVNQIVERWTDLYYASQFTGTTVTNLRAFQFAMGQIGISAEHAQQMLGGFVERIRENPNLASWFEGITHIKFDYEHPVEMLNALVKGLKDFPFYQQVQIAKEFGITADELLRMQQNSDVMNDSLKARADLMKRSGEDWDAVAKANVEYDRTLSAIKDDFDLIWGSINKAFVLDVLKQFDNWLQIIIGHQAEIKKWIKDTIDQYAWLKDIFDFLTGGDHRIEGAATGKVSDAAPGGVKDWFISHFGTDEEKAAAAKNASGTATVTPPTNLPQQAQADSGQAAMQFFMAQGWTKEQAAGLVANIQRESQFDPNASGDSGDAYGIGQWHADRQAEFKRYMGKDIKGSSLQEQLAFMQHELRTTEKNAGDALKGATTGEDAGNIVSRKYERAGGPTGDAVAEARLRGFMADTYAKNVTLNQNTNINIGNATSETAAQIYDRQNRVNQDAASMAAGAVQ